MRIVREPGHAPLAIIAREGDPVGSVAAFVSTAGIAPARRGVVEAALAAVLESRLPAARVTPQVDGVRVVLPMHDPGDVGKLATALVAPIGDATDLGPVRRKVTALATLGHGPDELEPVARCEGTLSAPLDVTVPTPTELESWRSAAVVNERVGFGVVGRSPPATGPRLPSGAAAPRVLVAPEPVSYVSESSALHLTWAGDVRLLGAARALARERSPLVAMLGSTDAGAHVQSLAATLDAHGACMSLRVEIDRDMTAARVGALVALATREARAALESGGDWAPSIDASEAAEQAAILALAPSDRVPDAPPHVFVGAPAPPSRDDLASAIETAAHVWDTRTVEARTSVEDGQPSAWMLIGSPCGTDGESDGDTGASAVFAMAAARDARSQDVAAEPWIASDGVGILASGADVGRLADVLARPFVIDSLDEVQTARGQLLESVHPALAALAQVIAPGRPATVLPTGTTFALLALSDASIAARAEALRHGPLRVSVIANAGAHQSDDAVSRVDRWIARNSARACPVRAGTQSPKPGTYAIATDDGSSEAYLALPVADDASAEAAAIAAMLDGDGGLLHKALGDGLARGFGARMLGASSGRTLVVHLEAPTGALDAAVSQTRALLDRMRQGAITDDDLGRAKRRIERERAAKLADPRQRLVSLFRGDKETPSPTLDRVRAFASASLHDDALVIVAARPRPRKP
jgi:hypothetical protein